MKSDAFNIMCIMFALRIRKGDEYIGLRILIKLTVSISDTILIQM